MDPTPPRSQTPRLLLPSTPQPQKGIASTAPVSPMAHIRLYHPNAKSDYESCLAIFRETADSSLHDEPAWTIGSYLWCRPYLHIEPASCLVLDDGSGKAVGYCIGTSDTATFCQRWRTDYLTKLNREKDPQVFHQAGKEVHDAKVPDLLNSLWNDVEAGCNGSVPGLWDEYPGHLHIDILPSHQGKGYGPQLIKSLLQGLKHQGCKGVHMGVVASNAGALKFYEREGFRRYEGINTDGEAGRSGGAVIMVKKL